MTTIRLDVPSETPVLRHADGSIDIAAYKRIAREQRRSAFNDLVLQLARAARSGVSALSGHRHDSSAPLSACRR